ncbi:MAG: BON domain-containing protein [Blastocatellia bacterium]|nr:BON domain-containing protein [Blastocatellia bacterium]
MRRKFFTITAGILLSSLAFTACETTTPTNNARVTNSNQAVVVNNNSSIVTNSNSNMMTNSNMRNSNVTREEYDKNRADYERDRGSSTIGQGVNDSWLWFKTKTALAAVNDLRDSTINVDVVNDVVTLRGTVGTAAQKTQAETTAKGIDGVKSVKNELKVSATDSMTNQMVNGNTNSRSNSNSNR